MYTDPEASFASVFSHKLLDAPRCILVEASALEKIGVLRMSLHVAGEYQPHRIGEQYIAILCSFALIDENFAVAQVDVADFDVYQLVDSDRGVEQKAHHDFVLGAFDGLEESAEVSFS